MSAPLTRDELDDSSSSSSSNASSARRKGGLKKAPSNGSSGGDLPSSVGSQFHEPGRRRARRCSFSYEEVKEPSKPNAADLSPELICSFVEKKLEEHHSRFVRTIDDVLTGRISELLLGGLQSPGMLSPSRPSTAEDALDGHGFSSFKVETEESLGALSRMPGAAFEGRLSFGLSEVEKKRSAKEVRFARKISPKTALIIAKESQFNVMRLVSRVVASPYFELASTLLIMTNALFFGVEAQLTADNVEDPERDRVFWAVGQVYTVLFTLEILVRILGEGRGFWCSPNSWLWNAFDTAIVLVGIVELGLSFLGLETKTNLTHVRIIRVARTVRVFRVVRILSVFTSLRILVNSVISTLRSLVWTLVLLVVILYLFGLLFTNATLEHLKEVAALSSAEEGEETPILRDHFGSLFRSIYTLFQAITNGIGWGPVAESLRVVHPAWEGIFCIFIMFVYFAVLNVVTGVFCQSAIESANQDKDTLVHAQLAMQRVYTEQLQLIFSQIDEDQTGMITLSMFEESLKDAQVKAYFDGLDLTTDDAWNLFTLLDANESNSVDLEEFVDGCLRLRGRARSIDIHMLMKQSQWTMKRLGDVLEKLAEQESSPGRPSLLQALGCLSRRSSAKSDYHRSTSALSASPPEGKKVCL